MKESTNGSRKYLAIISIILTTITLFLILIYSGQQSVRATVIKTQLELKETRTIVKEYGNRLEHLSPMVQQNHTAIAVIEEQYKAINDKLTQLITGRKNDSNRREN